MSPSSSNSHTKLLLYFTHFGGLGCDPSRHKTDPHRRGNRGIRGNSCSPNKIIGGATSTSCSPIFFCNLQLKVTSQTIRLLLTQKFSKIPKLLGLNAPDPIVYCVYLFSKNTYCIKLYFEFDSIDCFSAFFASPTEKSFKFRSPNRKIHMQTPL